MRCRGQGLLLLLGGLVYGCCHCLFVPGLVSLACLANLLMCYSCATHVLQGVAKPSHPVSHWLPSLFPGVQCIREKMDVIDLEDDEIDAEVLNSMSVTQVGR